MAQSTGSRFVNSARNIAVAWFGLIFYMAANFATRGVFAHLLDGEYLGLQSLFTNVLTILSLAELGVGSAITYALYAPIAHDDRPKIQALMALFRKAYITIGIVVLVIGALITSFITSVISDPTAADRIDHLHLYFYLFVFNTGISYFFSYKGVLITAYQREYIVSFIQYAALALMSVAQIVVLLITHNYLLFLIVMILSTLVQNMVIAYVANRAYPFLKEPCTQRLDRQTMSEIKKNVAALVLHRIGGIATTPLTSIFISKFVSLTVSGIYGNYVMVEAAIERIFDRFFWAIVPSVGNLAAEEDHEQSHKIFLTAFYINGLVYAVAVSGYFCAVNALVPLWVGEQYLFSQTTVAFAAVLMFAYGMRSAIQSFTSAYGLYWHSRYKPIAEFISFCILAYLLCVRYGVNGALFAGIVSKVVIATPYESYVLFKYGFKRSARTFVVRYLIYAAASLILLLAAFGICTWCALDGVAGLVVSILVGGMVPALGFVAIFWRLPEAIHARSLLMRVFTGIARKVLRT